MTGPSFYPGYSNTQQRTITTIAERAKTRRRNVIWSVVDHRYLPLWLFRRTNQLSPNDLIEETSSAPSCRQINISWRIEKSLARASESHSNLVDCQEGSRKTNRYSIVESNDGMSGKQSIVVHSRFDSWLILASLNVRTHFLIDKIAWESANTRRVSEREKGKNNKKIKYPINNEYDIWQIPTNSFVLSQRR